MANPRENPREVNDALTAAIPQLGGAGVSLRLISAYLARADARSMLGWTDSARADVREAYRLIRQARESKAEGVARTLDHDARRTLMLVVGNLVAAGRQREGLELLEFSRSRAEGDTILVLSAIRRGILAIRYVRLGDSLAAWTVSRTGVEFTPRIAAAAEVDALTDSTLAMAAERRDEDRLGGHLEALYQRLIRPLRSRIAPEDTLVVIADGSLGQIPFSALRHGAGPYLIEEHQVQEAVNLRQATGRASPAAGPRVARVGMVLDPKIDGRLFPRLRQLTGAREESAFVAQWARVNGNALWPRRNTALRPQVLSGPAARVDSVRDLMGRVSLLHFAGHAVADPEDPDSSQLVLAPGPGRGALGRLTAAQIAGMELGGLDLVVLSACSTLGGNRSNSEGFAGLGGAFLDAGARGVIGSLWEVDDALTRELMRNFYMEYRQNQNAAAALRAAQLRMLGNTNPRYSPPWAWAGFEYAGW
jgi:CHAT domain-containing protein